MASTECDPHTHARYVRRLGDTALVLSQRLGELVGSGPTLEEELANANIALDLLGQSHMLLEHAAQLAGDGATADSLAFERDEREIESLLLAERPNGDFAHVIVRGVLYNAYAAPLWESLLDSADSQLAAIAGKARKETAYHAEHANDWLERLGDGTDESRRRVEHALQELWPYSGEAFMADDVDDAVAAAGIAPSCATLEPAARELTRDALTRATLDVPESRWMQHGGKQGRHTEQLGHMLTELQHLARSHPGATW